MKNAMRGPQLILPWIVWRTLAEVFSLLSSPAMRHALIWTSCSLEILLLSLRPSAILQPYLFVHPISRACLQCSSLPPTLRYQSTTLGTFQTLDLMETFVNYHENIKKCVCIVYDPQRSARGSLALKAIRLKDSCITLFKEQKVPGTGGSLGFLGVLCWDCGSGGGRSIVRAVSCMNPRTKRSAGDTSLLLLPMLRCQKLDPEACSFSTAHWAPPLS